MAPRSLFPLPPPHTYFGPDIDHSKLARCSRNRLHRAGGWKIWCNEGVKCLNEISGENLSGKLSTTPNRLQRMSLQRLSSVYESLGAPPPEISPATAFRELCGNTVPYLTEDNGPRPYQEGLVSLPDVGVPISLKEGLDVSTHEQVCGRPDLLLNSNEEAQSALDDLDLVKPYVDPAFNSPRTYAKLLN